MPAAGHGQLGDGTSVNKAAPAQVAGLSGIVAIAAGGYHSLALKADGTAWAWGQNSFGQLGDGTLTKKESPVQVSGLSGAEKIAAGENHSLAIKPDGTAWVWGYNAYGQLGNGAFETSRVPVQCGMGQATAIAAGYEHNLALKEDGTAWAWGYSTYGQLGLPSCNYYLIPIQSQASPDDYPDQFGLALPAALAGQELAYAGGVQARWDWDWLAFKPGKDMDALISLGAADANILMEVYDDSFNPLAPGINGAVAVLGGATYYVWIRYDPDAASFSEAAYSLTITPPAPTIGAATISLAIEQGRPYAIAVTAMGMEMPPGTAITIEYDPAALQLIDPAAQAGGAPAPAGSRIPSTSLTLGSLASGQAVLLYDGPAVLGYTGILTVLKFEALQSGITSVTVAAQ